MGVTDHEFFQMNVTKAMHRIEKLYYETGGDCYLSFSGGKDSTIVLALIKLCEELGTIPKNAAINLKRNRSRNMLRNMALQGTLLEKDWQKVVLDKFK